MKILKQIFEPFIILVERMNMFQKSLIWYFADGAIMVLSALFTHYLFINVVELNITYYMIYILLFFVIYLFLSVFTNLGSRIKRYISIGDIIRLFLIVVISSILSNVITSSMLGVRTLRFMTMTALTSSFGIVTLRLVWQSLYRSRGNLDSNLDNEEVENIVLIGAGDGGSLFVNSYKRHPSKQNIVAIIDDNPAKWNTNIDGIKVVGGLDMLEEIVKSYNVEKAVIAIPSLLPEDYVKILEKCNNIGLKVFNMPKVEDVLLGIHNTSEPIRKVEISDLLGRKEVDLDESKLRDEIHGKVILITGAGGSIGSEIARQVSSLNPEKVILLGHGENSIYNIYHELINHSENLIQFIPVIADIQDYHRILNIFNNNKPNIVYHAAAHKHVPLMEANPQEAFKNNIIGTYNVARAVDEAGVDKMVMISTDKAVRPPNVMGATKRIAELIVSGFGKQSKSVYCAVRFGNVLGSRGSVIPAFEKMIAEGGPVKVTDFRMIRYFMTIPEASRLVIHAGAFARNGEVFILDMGEPVKIIDLARKMILLSGYTEKEIEIVESGIRPGEKLYEELITSPDNVSRQVDDKLFVSKVEDVPLTEIKTFIEKLTLLQDNRQLLKDEIIKFANDSAKYN